MIIEAKNLHLDDLIEQAAQRLAKFLEREKQNAGTAADREMVVHALMSKLQNFSTASKPLTRDSFIKLLTHWVKEAPRQGQRIDISRIVKYAPAELIGREDELKLLTDAWLKVQSHEPKRPHILTFVALGGEGKTSLVAKWFAELAHQDWPGCDAVFAWSFYSQGTREQVASSSDLFLKEAITFFGDATDSTFASSNAGPYEKGQRLAGLVGKRRNLLLLDGLEPLQHSPTSLTPGELKDQGIAALLKNLAGSSHGLCVVTTRFSLPDLKTFWQTTAPEMKLLRLSTTAGVHLLKTLGVSGKTSEFEKLVEDVKGHALTLALLGGFLQRAFRGDIRQRDRVKFRTADEKIAGGHAFRVLDAYVKWLEQNAPKKTTKPNAVSSNADGQRAVATLRLMGLFDRPADADCLAALRSATIPGLTEPLSGVSEADWDYCLSGLESARLLTVTRDPSGALVSLDAHPLLREYFEQKLCAKPRVWRAANKRLFEHILSKSSKLPASLPEAAQLVIAIRHGNAAGLHKKAFEVHFSRLDLDHRRHLTDMLGAPGAELEALSSFFLKPWSTVTTALSVADRAYTLRQTGMVLRAAGRLQEAEDCLLASVAIFKRPQLLTRKSLRGKAGIDRAVNAMRHLAQLHVLRGRLGKGLELAEESVKMLNDEVTGFEQVAALNTLADIQHNSGAFDSALANFKRAELLQSRFGSHPRLRRLQGYRYCDLLLTFRRPVEVVQRATELLTLPDELDYKVGYALALVIRGRANLLLMQNSGGGDRKGVRSDFVNAIDRLRDAGQHGFLAIALVARAEYFAWKQESRSARSDLNEAFEIATRGPMPLLTADIHLCRVRLFHATKQYPWKHNERGDRRTAEVDLVEAKTLVFRCGYFRRKQDLADLAKVFG